jgi:thioredoxin 1
MSGNFINLPRENGKRGGMNSVNIGIGILVVIFMLLMLLPQLRARRMRQQPAPDYSAIGEGGKVVTDAALLYFWRPSCAMCKGMGPVLDQVQQGFPHIYRVNVDDNLDLARQFGVMGTPTMVVVKDNVIKDVMVGAKSAQQIAKRLQ